MAAAVAAAAIASPLSLSRPLPSVSSHSTHTRRPTSRKRRRVSGKRRDDHGSRHAYAHADAAADCVDASNGANYLAKEIHFFVERKAIDSKNIGNTFC